MINDIWEFWDVDAWGDDTWGEQASTVGVLDLSGAYETTLTAAGAHQPTLLIEASHQTVIDLAGWVES